MINQYRQKLKEKLNKLLVLVSVCGFQHFAFSQVFDWYEDGFYYNQTVYTDIDGSGIDVTILGMQTGSPNSINYYYNWLKVGIDNNGNQGIQHTYTLLFSEPVNLSFDIADINADSIDGFCFNDQLSFSGNPIFTQLESVLLNDTFVYPQVGAFQNGGIRVSYSNIDSLSFTHGTGNGCNPGHLFISPLFMNGSQLSINENKPNKQKKVLQILDLQGTVCEPKANTFLIYRYDDGSTAKIFFVE